jgi:hypothetical protein
MVEEEVGEKEEIRKHLPEWAILIEKLYNEAREKQIERFKRERAQKA